MKQAEGFRLKAKALMAASLKKSFG